MKPEWEDRGMSHKRFDGRETNEIRPVTIARNFVSAAAGSVCISAGQTTVLCTASVLEETPPWMAKDPEKGWITAEYRMLPGSTTPRSKRSDRPDGRATEIQRLIGRSLRAVADLEALGPRTVYLDCDVVRADGGTRTLSVTGAFVALVDALFAIRDRWSDPQKFPLTDSVAAVSVGILDGRTLLDLAYVEDVAAAVDMNLVMTGSGRYIEIQGTGEESTYSETELTELLRLGKAGISELTGVQRAALNDHWAFHD